MTRNYRLSGHKVGALIVRVAESLGYKVERRRVKGQVQYRVVGGKTAHNINYCGFTTFAPYPTKATSGAACPALAADALATALRWHSAPVAAAHDHATDQRRFLVC